MQAYSINRVTMTQAQYKMQLLKSALRGGIMSQIFEAFMVLCFGISWPTSILKSYTSRTAKGKSIIFLVFIFIGYTFGILSKLTAVALLMSLFFT